MILIMSTGRLKYDVVYIPASQGIYFYPGMQVYYWNGIWNMIYDNLLKLKDELKGKPEEKPRLRRVMSILMRRYDYGVQRALQAGRSDEGD